MIFSNIVLAEGGGLYIYIICDFFLFQWSKATQNDLNIIGVFCPNIFKRFVENVKPYLIGYKV